MGALLYGADPGLVAARRQQLVGALQGSDASNLQVTRISGAEARRSAADVEAALTTHGFFAGRPVVVIEGGTDGLAKGLEPVLQDLRPEDGFLIITADQLPARSRLRKLFEAAPGLAAIGLYPQAMGAREIEDALARQGVCGLSTSAAAMMAELASDMDFGAFQRFLDVVALYGIGRTESLDLEDVARLAPLGLDGDVDVFVMSIADGETAGVGPRLRRLEAGGAAAVGITLALQRHFRGLLTAASSKAGIGALRPPPLGPRRDRFLRQLRLWNIPRLEQANRLLFDVDARLRSIVPPPEYALLERTALRLSMLAPK